MMKYDPNIHHRRSIRLRGYDYAQAGAYFITLCTQNRECHFGAIVEGEMQRNAWITCPLDAGLIFDIPVEDRWEAAMRKLGIDPAFILDDAGHA